MQPAIQEWLSLREQYLARVKKVLITDLKVQRTPAEIDPDAPLFGTGIALDSVDAVELVVSLETEFGFKLDDEALARPAMRTVNTLVDLVMKKHGGEKQVSPDVPAGFPAVKLDDGHPLAREVKAIRTTTALCEAPSVTVLRVSGAGAFAALDKLCTCPLTLQDTQVRLTLMLNDAGQVVADASIARDDEGYFLLVEGADVEPWLRKQADVEVQRFDATHRLVSLHGPWAWELLAACLGPDVIGMPYLSFLRGEGGLVCFRTGKTGEFGYELLVPNESAAQLVDGLVTQGKAWGLERVTQPALDACALENWFFCIRQAGITELTPLQLGLQWRLSPKKDFVGAAAARAAVMARLTCVVAEGELKPGAAVSHDGARIGRVVASVRSVASGWWVANALLDLPFATPGLMVDVGGVKARTLSPPAVNNRSLFVSPQRHAFAEHGANAFVPLALAT